MFSHHGMASKPAINTCLRITLQLFIQLVTRHLGVRIGIRGLKKTSYLIILSSKRRVGCRIATQAIGAAARVARTAPVAPNKNVCPSGRAISPIFQTLAPPIAGQRANVMSGTPRDNAAMTSGGRIGAARPHPPNSAGAAVEGCQSPVSNSGGVHEFAFKQEKREAKQRQHSR